MLVRHRARAKAPKVQNAVACNPSAATLRTLETRAALARPAADPAALGIHTSFLALRLPRRVPAMYLAMVRSRDYTGLFPNMQLVLWGALPLIRNPGLQCSAPSHLWSMWASRSLCASHDPLVTADCWFDSAFRGANKLKLNKQNISTDRTSLLRTAQLATRLLCLHERRTLPPVAERWAPAATRSGYGAGDIEVTPWLYASALAALLCAGHADCGCRGCWWPPC